MFSILIPILIPFVMSLGCYWDIWLARLILQHPEHINKGYNTCRLIRRLIVAISYMCRRMCLLHVFEDGSKEGNMFSPFVMSLGWLLGYLVDIATAWTCQQRAYSPDTQTCSTSCRNVYLVVVHTLSPH